MSQATRLPHAVLDADIIFSRVLHELMGRAADDLRLFDLLWSEELLAEVRRSLVEKKGLSEEVAARWVGYLSQGCPVGRVDISTVPRTTAATVPSLPVTTTTVTSADTGRASTATMTATTAATTTTAATALAVEAATTTTAATTTNTAAPVAVAVAAAKATADRRRQTSRR